MSEAVVQILPAPWEQYRDVLMAVRVEVFVGEQGVPLELERDARDPDAYHLLAATRQGRPVGTARLLPDGQIGRMAVLAQWRGRGVGRQLLEVLVRTAAEQGLKRVFLHAQCSAIGFYERQGFRPQGAVFEEAGIAHRQMTKSLESL